MKSNANTLTQLTIKALSLKGYKCWRQNNGATYDPTRKVFRAGSSTKGIPDVIGFHLKTGRFAAAEIKFGKDRLTPEQKQFLKDVEESGGLSLVIRSSDDIENILTH